MIMIYIRKYERNAFYESVLFIGIIISRQNDNWNVKLHIYSGNIR
jgi:hypothetical protein